MTAINNSKLNSSSKGFDIELRICFDNSIIPPIWYLPDFIVLLKDICLWNEFQCVNSLSYRQLTKIR